MGLLYDELSQSFPEEFISPFGHCLIIPVQQFREEWKNQLASEGCSVFSQAYNGRVVFLVKRKDSQTNGETLKIENHTSQLKRLIWDEATFKLVEKLRGQGYGYRRIVNELAKRGFKTNPTSVMRKLKKRENANKPKPSEDLNPWDSNPGYADDSLFREYLEASKVLYPKFKKACALLLKEASKSLC